MNGVMLLYYQYDPGPDMFKKLVLFPNLLIGQWLIIETHFMPFLCSLLLAFPPEWESLSDHLKHSYFFKVFKHQLLETPIEDGSYAGILWDGLI